MIKNTVNSSIYKGSFGLQKKWMHNISTNRNLYCTFDDFIPFIVKSLILEKVQTGYGFSYVD